MVEFADQQDEVEFLYETGPLKCQLCLISLHSLSPEQRQAHYDCHFTEEPKASSTSSAKSPIRHTPSSANSSSRSTCLANDVPSTKENVFWTQAHVTAPPNNFTPGLIQTLKHALLKTHAKGLTTRAMLCHEEIIHVASERWDRGWGCGYRNFLMICTALVGQTLQPLYFPLLDDPTPPGVRNLQMWIEDAWADGFDREGAEQFKHKLVGTKKWVGTADLYVAFVSRGIPAQLVDFPGSERGPEAITEWVTDYFSPPVRDKGQIDVFNALKGASPVLCTQRMPLILQHAGHSRTVVGIEVNKKGSTNLLIFDPSIRPSPQLQRAALANFPSLRIPSEAKNGSPSVLHRFLHSRNDGGSDQNRKRRASSQVLNEDDRPVKRVRDGIQQLARDDATVVISDAPDNDDVPPDVDSLDPVNVVNFFRVNQSKLRKKDKYQILWFPLDPPLEKNERWARRIVTSERAV